MAFLPVLLRASALLASVAASTALIVGFFGRLHPAFDSFAHFRVHLAVALLVCAALLLLARFRWHAGVAALLALGAIGTTLPPSMLRFNTAQAALAPADPNQPVYRLLQLNLRWNHPDPNRVLSLIGETRPDVVTLEEVSPMWAKKLALLEAAYPHQVICPARYAGNAILSRRPFAGVPAERCNDGALTTASVDFGGTAVNIAAIHLAWPWPYWQSGNIEKLKPLLSALDETAILAGDFNATTWSAAVERVASAGGLTLVEGVGATWIDYVFPRSMRWAGLPIDHIMVKGEIEVRNVQTLGDVGSDHWPLLMEFSLRAEAPEPDTAMAALTSP